ncbi:MULTISPECIES: adenosylcobinamide-GDP ribazoletransferase [unclassified Thalassolituus]|uniref:adenosylcobinamide-GDP ribazoletransferase n=1 Tax=unclassified Thalassolituus TaxID=2624967 RepID=UPI001CE2E741|nr:adenosylcobinamide-GDP ribazoletransferase [Thalassolituus sp. UBA2009]MCA6061644.1 adenosylcobinamide-GDP ribazoletransferase [Thalassolituus sp. ST750PaO-4]
MNLHWWAFWYAMAFLTRLPTPYLKRVDEAVAARSLVFYPLVGALLGLCLLAFTAACVFYNPQVSLLLLAALLLFIWVVFSGALHLDGLADSADAWVGGLGNKERTLAIMKDPQSGPMGVTVIAVILLVKFAAIYALLDKAQSGSGSWNIWLLIAGFMLVPMLARGAVPGLLATTPYVRKKGLASALVAGATPLVVGITGTLLALLAGVFLQTQALFILALWLTILMMARAAMIKRLGGCTGDTLGATIEIQEALLLAAIAL